MKVFLRNQQGSNATGVGRQIGLNMYVYTHLYTYVYICICKCFYIKDREQHWMRGSSKWSKYITRTFMYVRIHMHMKALCVCVHLYTKQGAICMRGSRPNGLNMCIYTRTYTHVYTHIYMYIYISVYKTGSNS